jgi:hypothetical protein
LGKGGLSLLAQPLSVEMLLSAGLYDEEERPIKVFAEKIILSEWNKFRVLGGSTKVFAESVREKLTFADKYFAGLRNDYYVLYKPKVEVQRVVCFWTDNPYQVRFPPPRIWSQPQERVLSMIFSLNDPSVHPSTPYLRLSTYLKLSKMEENWGWQTFFSNPFLI